MSGDLRRTLPWLVASTVYAAMVLLELPRPLYLPQGRVWAWSQPEGAIAMGWYGAVFVSGLAGLLCRLFLRAPRTRAPAADGKAGMAVILLIFLEAAVLTVFELLRP